MARTNTQRVLLIVSAAVAAAFIAFIFVRYRDDIADARTRVTSRGIVATTACGQIEYADVGTGPAVLVIHGAGGGFDQGLDFAGALTGRGFRVIAVSRFGYLRTPLPADASPAAQADAHACLLDTLGIGAAAVVAASAGAPSAMQFALRYPERSAAMVLLVPAAFAPRPAGLPPIQAPPATQLLFDTALKSDFLFWAATRMVRRILTQAILATPPEVVRAASAEERRRADETLRHILPVSSRRAGLVNDGAVTSALQRYELERIAAPTLVISVADDLFGTYDIARYTVSQIRGARFVGYPSGGHLWIGHSEDVVSEIETFLRARVSRMAHGGFLDAHE
jgi:pimeloyl-ACP methyl ester carboxylesterase